MILFSQNLLFQILLQPCLYHVMQIFASVFQHIQTASHFRCRAEIPDCLFHPMILSAAVAEKRENSLSGQIICTQPGRYRRGNVTTPFGRPDLDHIIFIRVFVNGEQQNFLPCPDFLLHLKQQSLKI